VIDNLALYPRRSVLRSQGAYSATGNNDVRSRRFDSEVASSRIDSDAWNRSPGPCLSPGTQVGGCSGGAFGLSVAYRA